ncbi:hypothetical protein R3P38DRAFT_2932087 [Favolaschia claudopus]|uniref:Uncharacterized protein n=1 Tax=Favolaschia claudopus TaxID=2862362 RepID=A0AAW0BRG9_9AGAR
MQWWRNLLASGFIPPFLQKLHTTRSPPLSSRHSNKWRPLPTGEFGAAGTNGLIGGDGGPGEARQVNTAQQRKYPVGNVSGGIGGPGGSGVDHGGQDGTGKGPVVNLRRRGV